MNRMDEKNEDCMVSVICSTYNQKKYISKCLDSLVSQKTNFKFEIIIRDDASTDGQQQIILQYAERYPNIIKLLLLKHNHYQRGLGTLAFVKAFNMSNGKYIAICEGDDFWTDNNKLQIQVDFMEKHPEYSLCGHGAYYANEDGTLRTDKYFAFMSESGDIPIEELLSNWTMATNSLLYRKSARKDLIIPYQGKCINGDFAQVSYLAFQGKVYYINKLMSAYRVNSNGSLTQLFKQDKNVYKEKRCEFFKMLDRMDEYSQYKYTDSISAFKRECIFDYYLYLEDGSELKKYRDILNKKDGIIKIKYFLCVYFPILYKCLKMIRSCILR